MKSLKYTVAAALAASAIPGAAEAATIVTTGGNATTLQVANLDQGANNSFTIGFSDANLTNPFSEILTFTTDVGGLLNILVSTTATSPLNDTDFSRAFLTGSGISGMVSIAQILGDPNETLALNDFRIGPGTFTIMLQGTPGTANGALGGTVAFQAGAVAAAVPEPATWAMMLLGFGAIGASMRRRRARNVSQLA